MYKNWNKLTEEQKSDLLTWRTRTMQMIREAVFAFEQEHPEIEIDWRFSTDPQIQNENTDAEDKGK